MLTVLALGLSACPVVAPAQDHHPNHKDFYRFWIDPATGGSCCNARIEKDGVETGDCEPTKAKIVGGQWFVYVRQLNAYIPVPDAKVIRERNPSGQDAHVCWQPNRGVICFVPPDTGG
jgi:hypothetical protein